MKKKNWIVLYRDELDYDLWEDYCYAANVPVESSKITIYFNDEDVESVDYDDENKEEVEDEEGR